LIEVKPLYVTNATVNEVDHYGYRKITRVYSLAESFS